MPIGGGAVHGKDPLKVDPAGQALARKMALDLVLAGGCEEATVWLAWRPGDVEPRWTHIQSFVVGTYAEGSGFRRLFRATPGYLLVLESCRDRRRRADLVTELASRSGRPAAEVERIVTSMLGVRRREGLVN